MRRHVLLLLAFAAAACGGGDDRASDDAGVVFHRPDASGIDPGHGDEGEAGILVGGGGTTSSGDGGGPGPSAQAALLVNEVDYDEVGTDDREFVEIVNPTAGTVDLSGYAVVFVGGTPAKEYARVALTGTLPSGKMVVIAPPAVTVATGATRIDMPQATNNLRNTGANGVGVIDTRASVVVDALSYGGSVAAATVTGINGSVSFDEGTPTTAVDVGTKDASLARIPSGADSNDASKDWKLTSTLTPGAANVFSP